MCILPLQRKMVLTEAISKPLSHKSAQETFKVEIYERHLKAAIVPPLPRGERLFLLFYLRVVSDAAR